MNETKKDTKGVCLWLTGLSGAGKSTIVNELAPVLAQHGCDVSVFDGARELRRRWWERSNKGMIVRLARSARVAVADGRVVLCCSVSGSRRVRGEVRRIVGAESFIEVYVFVSSETAASRLRGRRAALSLMRRVHGSLRRTVRRMSLPKSEPYQTPRSPDVAIDNSSQGPDEGAQAIIRLLMDRGFLGSEQKRT